MKTFNFFEITQNSDNVEGEGYEKGTGIAFNTHDEALEFTKTDHMKPYAVMGYVNKKQGNKYSVAKRSVIIFDSIKEYEENSKDAQRLRAIEKAKKKLTQEELKLLGLE